MKRMGITLVAVAAAVAAGAAPASAGTAASARPVFAKPTCATATTQVRCFAEYRATAAPAGLSPADIASAYELGGDAGAGHAVAVVDAYDNPNAEADLATYRATYGLPACTTANGCFQKLNQRGEAGPYPTADPGWGMEISLDLDAVSAACPACSIRLVEADQPDLASLAAAEDTAAALGVDAVSNSFGATESTAMSAYARDFDHPGTSIVASSGDAGFGPASFPAVLSSVIAVGGTALTQAPSTTRGWTERAWSGASSGCSAYIAKPAWQHDTHCSMRTVADVSAVADPATGFAVYDTYGLGGQAGWLVAGGTSLSAPLISGMIARSGHVLADASTLYTPGAALNDVLAGTNGYCGDDYLCTAGPGYDGPTGMGTPNGLAAL